MKALRAFGLAVVGLGLVVALGCDRSSSVPMVASEASSAPEDGRLPFDREAQKDGISPTSAVIPPGAQIPAGTPVVVRIQSSISSATAVSDGKFEAVLDEPIVVKDQVLAARGTAVIGRVVEARRVAQMQAPGYLRLALSSIALNGKQTVVRTSSNFLKGAGPVHRRTTIPIGSDGSMISAVAIGGAPSLGNAMTAANATESVIAIPRDVTVSQGRRLTFRLIEPVPLHP
jgi:hypothetical protein